MRNRSSRQARRRAETPYDLIDFHRLQTFGIGTGRFQEVTSSPLFVYERVIIHGGMKVDQGIERAGVRVVFQEPADLNQGAAPEVSAKGSRLAGS